MRSKKRYVRFKSVPSDLPQDAKFIFQDELGFVFKVSPKQAEKLRSVSTKISGSIRKLKMPKRLNEGNALRKSGMK